MSTVIVKQAEVRLTMEQLVAALQQLSPEEREQVRRELVLMPWEERLDSLLARVRAQVDQDPISDEDLNADIDSTRDALHRQSGN